ncbi:MAG TPA: protein kinase [Terriglobia bacterium]|nr:protein kinase [Terriglobia bacterium]
MKPERWRQIDALLGEALELESSQRDDFLNEACAGDEELRNRIDALLSAHEQAQTFIEVPALALAAEALADEKRSMVGRQLSHYRVCALVGAGGMGAVWKARDTKLDRDVAIKTFAERLGPLKDPLARFEREARLLASLNHPNIAIIHGFEEDQGIRFLVLEFIDGETLDDRLRRGAIPLEESLRLARQITEALDAAHEKGVIHRDLKPANIKINGEGIVKVLDFGLAKALEVVDSPLPNVEATDERMIVGTAAYMAPEQLAGRKVDKRADIWAFGVVLYEMVTGSRPFHGSDSAETLSAIVTKEPDFERVPPSIRNLLRKCLEKDPKNRLRDIADAWELVRDPSSAADALHAQTGRRFARLPWVMASVLGIVVVALSLIWREPEPPQLLRSQIYPPPGSLIPLGTPAISSNSLAYVVKDAQGEQRIYVKRHENVDGNVLPGTEGAMRLVWSAGEDSLAFTIKGRLLWIDPFRGGSPRDLTTTGSPWQLAGNQNDEIIARDKGSLVLISAKGDPRTPIPDSGDLLFPTFLGDGKRFLAQVRDEKEGSSIYLAGLEPRQRTLVVDNVLSAPILARIPGGKTYLLVVPSDRNGTDLLAYKFDEVRGQVVGEPALLVPNIGMVGDPAVRPAVGVSPDGGLAYQTGSEVTRQLRFVDRSGNLVRELSPELSVEIPRLSPDESLVVGVRRSGGEDVWIIDLKKERSEKKTFNDTSDSYPIWSGDGTRRVAYRRSGRGIYALDPIRNGEPQPLTKTPGAPTSWHGQFLLYTFPLLHIENAAIHLLDMASGKERVMAFPFGRCGGAVFSRDGKYIAFDCNTDGRHQVYFQPISGLEPIGKPIQVSEKGGNQARWRDDGKELFFISPENNLMAALISPEAALPVAPPQKLFDLGSLTNRDIYSSRNGYDVTLDGQQFLVVSEPPFSPGLANFPITVSWNWWVELEKKFAR